MYLAPRGTKNHHRQFQEQRQQRGHANGHNHNHNHNHFTGSSNTKHNKRRFHNNLASLILCICFLWIYVTYVFFQTIPKSSSTEVHSIAQSPQQLRSVLGQKPNKVPAKLPINNPKQFDFQPYNIVHSLTTRFMLGQTGQPILARARYLLFETFCQPTVRFQTLQEYSWFVLADPGLDQDILKDLHVLLSKAYFPNENAYLILTDNPNWAADGVGVPGVTSYGAGFEEIARGVRDGNLQVLTGDAQKLVRILEENIETKDKPLMLIETMLDADDGLNNRAMEKIQDLAVSHTQQQQQQQQQLLMKPTLNSTWWLLCGTDHIEWHNRDIYRLTAKQLRQKGLSGGIIGTRHAPQYCASAGFTRVGLTTEASPKEKLLVFPQVAYSNHALATEEFDRCLKGSKEDIGPNHKSYNSTKALWSNCFRRDFDGFSFVLKGRTVTSDSMDHMGVRTEDYRDLPWETKDQHPLLGLEEQENMWGIAKQQFSIDQNAAQTTSLYLREHLQEIIRENKESRCAPGFPCREVADVAFKKMAKYVDVLQRVNKQQLGKK